MVLIEHELDTKVSPGSTVSMTNNYTAKSVLQRLESKRRRREEIPARNECIRANAEKVQYQHIRMHHWRKHGLMAAAHMQGLLISSHEHPIHACHRTPSSAAIWLEKYSNRRSIHPILPLVDDL